MTLLDLASDPSYYVLGVPGVPILPGPGKKGKKGKEQERRSPAFWRHGAHTDGLSRVDQSPGSVNTTEYYWMAQRPFWEGDQYGEFAGLPPFFYFSFLSFFVSFAFPSPVPCRLRPSQQPSSHPNSSTWTSIPSKLSFSFFQHVEQGV